MQKIPSRLTTMLKFKKITTFLLLTAFLATSFGNAFGFVSCDSGCFSETHHENHHNDESHETIAEDFALPLDQQLHGSDDSCLDFLIQMIDGDLESHEYFKAPASPDTFLINNVFTDLSKTNLHVCATYLLSPLKVSQTILAHRTVVLLA